MGETLGGLGEFGLIARIVQRFAAGDATLLGPGDDAAVVRVSDGRVVATTDLLVEGSHFRLDWSSAYDVGRKAAAQNLADLAAMGARPTALLVGLAAPIDWPVSNAEALADGLYDEVEPFGASVVGGDVVRGDVLVVAVTALGDLVGREPVTRAGANVGDAVWLLGSTGRSAAGLALLTAGEDDLLRAHPDLVAAHRRPEPPYADAYAWAAAGATALIDVSDGLVADAGHVAAASGVRLEIEASRLPLDGLAIAADALDVDMLVWALAGGEDHAFLVTAPPGVTGPGARIGHVVEGEGVDVRGGPALPTAGWDHFA